MCRQIARWTLTPLLIAAGGPLYAQPLGATERDAEIRHVAALPPLASLDPARPTVVLVELALVHAADAGREWLARAASRVAVVGRGAAAQPGPAADFPAELLSGYVPGDAPPPALVVALRMAMRHAAALAAAHEARVAAAASREALAELTRAGIALGTERDPIALLAAILTQARRITRCDAGSIYLVERAADPDTAPALHFKLSQNQSLPDLPLARDTVPLDHTSAAGHAAVTGEPLVIDDVYALPPGTSYRVNRSFDDRSGYLTRSMLVIPMKSQRDEVVGVLQLINAKRHAEARLMTAADVEREVVPFAPVAVEHAAALAAQAAVSIENSMLHASIERLFDGFVSAAATAVEARDPTTYGHSRRVAELAVRLAEALDRGAGRGPHRGVRFTRDELLALRYAALLHDFGKVAVRKDVLVKEKKLHPAALEQVNARFVYLAQQAELECERMTVTLLRRAAAAGPHHAGEVESEIRQLDEARERRIAELTALAAGIAAVNDGAGRVAPHEGTLERAAGITYRDASGGLQALLTPLELRHLRIERGNLDDDERAEVESHVAHTYRFLQQIPWTSALAAVPLIAHTHHEKPNGRGYPRGLAGEAIPLSARIVAVADIFDALTATDRPYKRAMPVEHALVIMRAEAAEGGLDADLLETFVAAGLHETRCGSGEYAAVAAPLAEQARYQAPVRGAARPA